jgi:GntR family transcriptional repressor for pyruvate dehydrogenase complex
MSVQRRPERTDPVATPKRSPSLTVPVEKGTVVSLVMERIKEALVNRELKPGDYLPSESELSRSLGVGKSSIREAVKMLQAMGVVEVKRGQGTVIREHPGDDCLSPLVFQLILENGYPKDLLDLRIMFEPAYTVMAMKRATREDMARIEEAVDKLHASIRSGAPIAEDDLSFHVAILKATGNPLVIRIGETIMQLFRASIGRSMKTIPETALRDHRRILEAFREKDEETLRKAILKSFEGWKKSLYGA